MKVKVEHRPRKFQASVKWGERKIAFGHPNQEKEYIVIKKEK